MASPGVEKEADPERASSKQTECRQCRQEQPTQREGRAASRSLGTEGRGREDEIPWPRHGEAQIAEVNPQADQSFTTRDMGKSGLAGEDGMPAGRTQTGPTGQKGAFYF